MLSRDESGGATGSQGDSPLADALARRLTLREVEDLYTDEVLELTGGNKMQAARILGINRRTLYRRGDRQAAVRAAESH